MYVFDPRHFILTPWGNPKTGNYRAQFLLDSVLDLKANLRGLGSDLIIKLGQPESVLPGSAPPQMESESLRLEHVSGRIF